MSFLSSINQTPVVKFYSNVMDDVLTGVREAFLDEGVDEQVLQDLRQMWEAKVIASKAVDPPEVVEPPPPMPAPQSDQCETPKTVQQKQTNGVSSQPQQAKQKPSTSVNSQPPTTTKTFTPSQPQTISNSVVQDLNTKMVPIQLTLPAPAGSQDTQPRVLSIQVPASALATNQLQRILTAPVISATMALPVNVASTLLQQHVMATLQGQANPVQLGTTNTTSSNTMQLNGGQGIMLPENSNNRQFPHVNQQQQMSGNMNQIDGTYNSSDDESDIDNLLQNRICVETSIPFSITVLKNLPLQVDGIYDTSDDDDDEDEDEDDDLDDDDDDDDNDDKEDEENDEAENGIEEDPLNSGDDVSEGDCNDLFETENVVVCQYDKINRSRNKWKFYLKDGIMNLAGRDYIFQKANGDAEW